MRLTAKLIGYLNRVFDKSARPVLALRIQNSLGPVVWVVEDGVLTIGVSTPGVSMSDGLSSGSGSESSGVSSGSYIATSFAEFGATTDVVSVDLADHTVDSLADYIDSLAGYEVLYRDDTGQVLNLSARVLIDGYGSSSTSNGDHLYAYTSLLWVYMEPIAAELKAAADQIDKLTRQMVPQTAEGQWLDELGGYYACDRSGSESDADYARRIIASVGRPAGNNVAIEMAINTITGGLQATVTDAPAQAFTSPYTGTSYGLFNVVYDINLEGSDPLNAYTSRVTAIVEALRDAGTHIGSIVVSGRLQDSYDTIGTATESMSALGVGIDLSDSAALTQYRHDGTYRRDGSKINLYNNAIAFDGSQVYGVNPGDPIVFNSGAEALSLTITIGGVPQPTEAI